MKTERVIALLSPFVVALTSCVVTYTDFPSIDVRTDPLPRRDVAIYYNVDPLAYLEQAMRQSAPLSHGVMRLPLMTAPSRKHYAELERVFAETRMFTKAIPSAKPPDQGIYCSVDVIHKIPSDLAAFFGMMTYGSLGFIPSYSGGGGYIVKYSFYLDGELKKEYRYEITRKGATWLGLLPLVWVNLFTPSEEEAFRATAYQFFLDAERDGYLKKD